MAMNKVEHAVEREIELGNIAINSEFQPDLGQAPSTLPPSPTPTVTADFQKEVAPDGEPVVAEKHVEKPAVELSRIKFILVFAALMISIFLYALDQLIIATAIPKIISQFNSLDQVAWVTNGFFVTLGAFVLAFAQYLDLFSSKWVSLFSIFVFELGSLLCGVAPNMVILILGRAIAGAGAAGIFTSCFQVIIEITTLQERPKYTALFGGTFGLASVLGPVCGGALTDHVSWRWCFYINLPIGGVAFLAILFFHENRPPLGRKFNEDSRPLYLKLLTLDWVALLISLGLMTCICLAFQYGGVQYAWSDGRVIALLVMIPVCIGLLWGWTAWVGDRWAMIPLGLLKRRTVVAAAVTSMFGWAAFMVVIQWVAIGFQACSGYSATKAGVALLPMIIPQIVFIIAGGQLVARTGRFKWVVFAGTCFTALGCGLIYNSNLTNDVKMVQGVSVFVGLGVALFLQNVLLAVQTELRTEPRMISRGMGITNYFGFFGRVFGIAVSSAIVNNKIPVEVRKLVPDLPEYLVEIVQVSISAIRELVPEGSQRDGVIEAYRLSIKWAFILPICCAIGSAIAAFCIPDLSLRPPKPADVESKGKEEVLENELKEGSQV